jgi:Na+/melibiose symporter-like transporter
MIGRRERWSYAAGDLGFNFVWQSIELYLLFFYVRGLGLDARTASWIFLAGAAVDWIADPVVGTLGDRLSPRVPLRAWIAVGGPLSVLLLAAAFMPLGVPPALVAPEALVIYLLLRIAYSLGNIPYAALTARLSAEPADHLALTGSRMQGAAIGGLIAAGTYLALADHHGPGTSFRRGALVLAALALPAFLATCLGVRERLQPASAASTGRIGPTLVATARLVARSRELRRLLLTILGAGLAVTVVNKSILFLFDELGAHRLGYWIALVPSLSLLLTAPVWTWAGTRFGRPRALVMATALKASVLVVALVIGGVWPIAILVSVSIVAGSGMSIMFWSLVPAAVADCEAAAIGDGEEGYAARVYALANIARKLAQAIAPQVIALALLNPRISILWGMAATTLLAFAIVLACRPGLTAPPTGA